MDTVLQLSQQQRVELFEQTSQQTGIEAVIVEKDFWVCWMLQELFRLPQIGEHIIFKGGTSLSKVFKVIECFSEDIDVSLDRGFSVSAERTSLKRVRATRRSNGASRP